MLECFHYRISVPWRVSSSHGMHASLSVLPRTWQTVRIEHFFLQYRPWTLIRTLTWPKFGLLWSVAKNKPARFLNDFWNFASGWFLRSPVSEKIFVLRQGIKLTFEIEGFILPMAENTGQENQTKKCKIFFNKKSTSCDVYGSKVSAQRFDSELRKTAGLLEMNIPNDLPLKPSK